MKIDNTYIMNLEGAYIYKDIQEGKKTTSKKRDRNKLFSATSPYSLETIRINKMFPNRFYILNDKQYTKKIINVTFDKNYTVWDEEQNWIDKNGEEHKGKRILIANKNKIRSYLYNNGFEMDGIKYIFYKRGSGKAKNGFALFIQENMKNKLLNKSRLGIKFKDNELLDLTSLLAYESLISSHIDFIIELNPKTEILLIDDIYGKEFKVIASVTREVNGKINTDNEELILRNCLTDGQGLLDESIFEKYNKSDNGFMLLRNDMFKCCAFNTKLQSWFNKNKITKLTDMFGNTYDADKIKLITTPNSLKFLKFAYKIKTGKLKDCYKHWINNVDSTFGVVKCDKDTNFGTYNRTTYQLLNSIPNLTYEDLIELTKSEREYVNSLKNDNVVFRNYLLRDYKLNYLFNESIDEGDISSYDTIDLINGLLLINPDIMKTKKFKDIKSELISNYINNLRMGKIRLENTKYVTLFANPYEMLLASIGNYNNTSIMQEREIYCPYYKDGQEFCASRNPHVNAGNVMYTVNKKHEEYNWFNLTDNICAINFFDNDAPDRLQGCDVDSDTILLLCHNLLIDKAKYCEDNFKTPINMVKGVAKPRKYNMNEINKLDIVLSNNYIGKIINLSQVINSYMNDAIFNNKSQDIIDELYNLSSRLSSLSQIEIDKSKKLFDNVNMHNELKIIKNNANIIYVEGEDRFGKQVNKMTVPKFFSMIFKSGEYRIFEKFNTPMDILQDVLVFNGGNRCKNIDFKDLLITPCELDNVNYKQINIIYKIISQCGKKINGLKIDTCKLNDNAKSYIRRKEKEKAVKELMNYKIKTSTILHILRKCFKIINDDIGFSKYSVICLNLLFSSNKLEVLKCFRNKDISNEDILVEVFEDDNWDYNIFGKFYMKTQYKLLKGLNFLD